MLCSRCNKRPAVIFIQKMDGTNNTTEGLCLSCAYGMGIKPISDVMKKFGIDETNIDDYADQLSGMMGDSEDDSDGDFEAGGTPSFPNLAGLLGGMFGPKGFSGNREGSEESADSKKPVGGAKQKSKEKEKEKKYLDAYCDNLTEKARKGKLDRIIGRDSEIDRTIQILCRRQKNNPCLIGEAGVGKTAIAEGIALKIANDDVPQRLSNKEIYLLDLTALVAGTQFRGQFESRVKGLINEVKEAGNVILFIDEIHTITGAGDASDGAMSAGNLLKPALSRGEIQVIGATTFEEYRKFIEKDQALERRFQTVTVGEPDIQDTIAILEGIKEYYEGFHHVRVSDRAVSNIVRLSERYVTDRFLPDKAIDLLDEACACCSLRSKELSEYLKSLEELKKLQEKEEEQSYLEEPDFEAQANLKSEILRTNEKIESLKPKIEKIEVSIEDISKVIELWTGIPAVTIEQDEFSRLADLEQVLSEKVIGQQEAVKKVADSIKRTRVGISSRVRPASFIFVGPTGVGKTELAKVLANELFSSVDPLIRLDMSEYMEKYAVSRLIGSPPGYVGYDEAGQLTEKVRRRPYSVVLFDEIEKAHPDVLNILLQILDEGRITDSQGRTVNFEHTVIIMTSNAGSNVKNKLAGFGESMEEVNSSAMIKALEEFLRPEFISRVDEVVVFNNLDNDSLCKIATLMLDELIKPCMDKGVKLEIKDGVKEKLAELSGGGKYGARDMRKTIRREIEDPVTDILVRSGGYFPALITVEVNEDKIKVSE